MQAYLSLRLVHMSEGTFSYVAAHLILKLKSYSKLLTGNVILIEDLYVWSSWRIPNSAIAADVI